MINQSYFKMKAFIILILCAFIEMKATLKYVQAITRHGARTTLHPEIKAFPNSAITSIPG